jgi:hypothetical protein
VHDLFCFINLKLGMLCLLSKPVREGQIIYSACRFLPNYVDAELSACLEGSELALESLAHSYSRKNSHPLFSNANRNWGVWTKY